MIINIVKYIPKCFSLSPSRFAPAVSYVSRGMSTDADRELVDKLICENPEKSTLRGITNNELEKHIRSTPYLAFPKTRRNLEEIQKVAETGKRVSALISNHVEKLSLGIVGDYVLEKDFMDSTEFDELHQVAECVVENSTHALHFIPLLKEELKVMEETLNADTRVRSESLTHIA